jgi:hypothetical protein
LDLAAKKDVGKRIGWKNPGQKNEMSFLANYSGPVSKGDFQNE